MKETLSFISSQLRKRESSLIVWLPTRACLQTYCDTRAQAFDSCPQIDVLTATRFVPEGIKVYPTSTSSVPSSLGYKKAYRWLPLKRDIKEKKMRISWKCKRKKLLEATRISWSSKILLQIKLHHQVVLLFSSKTKFSQLQIRTTTSATTFWFSSLLQPKKLPTDSRLFLSSRFLPSATSGNRRYDGRTNTVRLYAIFSVPVDTMCPVPTASVLIKVILFLSFETLKQKTMFWRAFLLLEIFLLKIVFIQFVS